MPEVEKNQRFVVVCRLIKCSIKFEEAVPLTTRENLYRIKRNKKTPRASIAEKVVQVVGVGVEFSKVWNEVGVVDVRVAGDLEQLWLVQPTPHPHREDVDIGQVIHSSLETQRQ